MKHRTAYQKATEKIEKEGLRQCYLIYGAAGLALWRNWQKKQKAIMSLFGLTQEIWQDCAADIEKSMIKMCYEETGIEVQNGDGKSWEDLPYLNGKINQMRITNAQWVYIRQQQLKWVAPQVTACIIIGLHRKWGFSFDRCARFYGHIKEIQAEFGDDPEKVRQACFDVTGINVREFVTKQGERKCG